MSLLESSDPNLKSITSDNPRLLGNKAFLTNVLVCSLNDEELVHNVNMLYEKAKSVNIDIEILKGCLEECAGELNITLPKQTGIKTLSGINPTETEWLWYPYIPLGKITLMTADPGTGKTFFCLYLAACISQGRSFFYKDDLKHLPGHVIYQSTEDGLADTIVPRLLKMHPDLNMIHNIDESYEAISLQDIERLEDAVNEVKPKLIVFDPLQAYLGAKVDMHRANEVRPVLGRISTLAERHNCAVIFVMHHSKMGQTKALYRALGSIDIVGIARSSLIIGNHPDNPKLKVVCHEKSSLAIHGKSFMYEITDNGIIFAGDTDLTANDVLNAKKSTRNKPSVCKDEVIDCLNDLLGVDGYAKFEDIKAMQEYVGCSQKTLYRAKQDLQLDTVSMGYSRNKVTYWLAPDVDKEKFKREHKPPKSKGHNVYNT